MLACFQTRPLFSPPLTTVPLIALIIAVHVAVAEEVPGQAGAVPAGELAPGAVGLPVVVEGPGGGGLWGGGGSRGKNYSRK